MTDDIDRAWWKEAVVYQIYPRSFNDTDGDGIGDLPGIVEKVDYLEELGVDVVWLCPVYESPDADNGYDIADYRSIDPQYGDMSDWEALLDELHARDMRLIMDLVVNHTSDRHEWFRKSRRREGEYEDYYRWADGTPDEPPNNWESIFGGPAWSYDEVREQWYLHLFHHNQPDLNWRNPAVREEITDMMEWWLEKGIDGFRLDAIDHLAKTEGLPDGEPADAMTGSEHYSHAPRLEEHLEVLTSVLDDHDVMTVGEMGGATVEQAAEYVGEDGVGLDMIFEFSQSGIDRGEGDPWDLEHFGSWELTELKEIVSHKQETLAEPEWDALFVGNHDQPRIVSRLGDEGAYREESAALIATFLMTLRGTPYVYQGEEIGMTNSTFETLEDMDDPGAIGHAEQLVESGRVDSFADIRDVVNYWSRDQARTPMQWSDEPHAGFTDGEPWLPVGDDYAAVNVERARADPDSVLHHYRELIDLRHESDLLVYGDYELLLPDHEQFFVYVRTLGDERALVVLNWSRERATLDVDVDAADAEVLIGNYDDPPADPDGSDFRPYEAVVYRL